MQRIRDRLWAMDLGAVVAMAWLFVALISTVVMGPQLGARGWRLLMLHHLICVVGSSHELWRSWRRRQRRRLVQPSQTVTTSSGSSASVHGA